MIEQLAVIGTELFLYVCSTAAIVDKKNTYKDGLIKWGSRFLDYKGENKKFNLWPY